MNESRIVVATFSCQMDETSPSISIRSWLLMRLLRCVLCMMDRRCHGIGVARLLTAVDLCDEIHAREDADEKE